MKKEKFASTLLLLVTFIWGSSYSVVKESLNSFALYTMMSFRFMGASLFLLIIFRKRLYTLTRKDFINNLFVGFSLFFSFFFLGTSLERIDASKNVFIISLFIVIVPILNWLIDHKKPSRNSLIAIIICLLGIIVLNGEINTLFSLGNILAFFCAIGFSVHMFLIERYNQKVDSIAAATIQFLVTGVCFVILLLIKKQSPMIFNTHSIVSILYMTLLATAFGFILQNYAQQFISAVRVSIILLMESVFGLIFAVFYLNEQPDARQIIGSIIILLGVSFEILINQKRKK